MKPIGQRFPRPSVMGIVNVTPDSFFDGGSHATSEDAIEHARRLHAEGAAIVDVGGESTRPESEGVTLDEELRRVLPVLEELGGEVPLSIDTSKAEVARRALAAGAELVNDVTALRGDPELAGVVAGADAYLCLMHMLGEPRTMQESPRYDDVVSDVAAFLEERLAAAVDAGIPEERICLDPGIGFGKTVEQNAELVRRLDVLARTGAARARRLLAQALARADAWRSRCDDRLARRQPGGSRLRACERCDYPSRARRQGDGRGADGGGDAARMITIELHGLELHGFHGVLGEEQRLGQPFLFDVWLDVAEPGADRIEDALDYRDVAACVADVSSGASFQLLESLAAAVADELMTRFRPLRARVRVRKPEVRLDAPVEFSAVTVERP